MVPTGDQSYKLDVLPALIRTPQTQSSASLQKSTALSNSQENFELEVGVRVQL